MRGISEPRGGRADTDTLPAVQEHNVRLACDVITLRGNKLTRVSLREARQETVRDSKIHLLKVPNILSE